jgi:hypothetical protein
VLGRKTKGEEPQDFVYGKLLLPLKLRAEEIWNPRSYHVDLLKTTGPESICDSAETMS